MRFFHISIGRAVQTSRASRGENSVGVFAALCERKWRRIKPGALAA
jgi:hypothetical protein